MEPYVTSSSLEKKSTEWLEKISHFNSHEMNINPGKAALLVIDMQKYFLDPSSEAFTCGGVAVLPMVKKLIAAFREAKRPVIYTRHVHHQDKIDVGIMGWWWEGMCREDDPLSEVHPELAPLLKEKVILKHRYSSFYNTDLEIVLRCLKIEDIVITGLMTNLCCESTARDAYFRDYRVFFPADATGTMNEEMHLASLLNLAFGFAFVTKSGEIIKQVLKQT